MNPAVHRPDASPPDIGQLERDNERKQIALEAVWAHSQGRNVDGTLRVTETAAAVNWLRVLDLVREAGGFRDEGGPAC